MKNNIGTLAANSSSWLRLLLAYPIVDYVLRKLLPIPVVSSFWDEGVLLVLLLFTLSSYMKSSPKMPDIRHVFLAFFVYGLGLMFTDMANFAASVEGFRAIYQYVIAFFIGYYLTKTDAEFEKLVKFMAVVGFLVGFYGVLQVVFKVETNQAWVSEGEATTTRAFSIVTSPNVLGSYMAFIAPVTLGLLLHAKTKMQRYIWAFCSLSSVAALLGTGSRGALFAFVFVVLVGGYVWDRRIGKYLLIAAVLGSLFLAVVPKETPVVGKVKDRVASLFTEDYFKSSAKDGRIARWTNAYHQMRIEPLFGAGEGHWGGAVATRHFDGKAAIYTDSYLFKTLAETGIIGVGLLISLVALTIRYALRTVQKWRGTPHYFLGLGLFCGLLAVGLHNAVENIFEVPFMSTYFWLMGGMMCALSLRSVPASEGTSQPKPFE